MRIKKMLCAVLLCSILALSFATVVSTAEDVQVKVDGETLQTAVSARLENDVTMVPMRAIFEALGMTVTWNDDTKTVTATDKDNTVIMTIGEKKITLNGKEIEISTAPAIISDTTMVPVRAVSESLNASVEWKADTKTVVIESKAYQETKDAWKENVGEINLSAMSVSGSGVAVNANIIEITSGGDFTVTGTNADAMIHVYTDSRVKLRLSGVNLTNTTGPAIFFEEADKAFVTITKDTENYLADASEYSVDAKGVISTSCNLEIKGEGSLSITSAANHGIYSKDDIDIEEGIINIQTNVKDGIHANEEIKIIGGTVTITAYGDGIQSEENLIIEGGTLNITTTGEVTQTSNNGFGGFGGMGGRGDRTQMPTTSGTAPQGDMNRTPPTDMGTTAPTDGTMRGMGTMPTDMEMVKPQNGDMTPPDMTEQTVADESEDTSSSTKGLKAGTDLVIAGGDITINSADHGVHSDATISVAGGTLNITSQHGKGISAHGDLVISGGEVNILKSTEGIEGKAKFTIAGGIINVTASDDGINAGGTSGRDVASRNDPDAETEHDLFIKGGTIYVNAAGDGIDSNGRIIITGGDIIVEGPTNSGNGALDSGGVITVDAGELLAIGASGMAETPGTESTQASFAYTLPQSYNAGDVIKISDASGNELISYTATKTGSSIIFSSAKLEIGQKYTISVGSSSYEIELTSNVTSNSSAGNMMGGMGGRTKRTMTEQ